MDGKIVTNSPGVVKEKIVTVVHGSDVWQGQIFDQTSSSTRSIYNLFAHATY